ncbi:MAG TPA: hypothetical protein VGN55_08195 [Xanthobacteraceae bacterium]|jgi:hypothetical protein
MQLSQRERHLFHLAGLLLFDVKKEGGSFSLTRTADVERPLHQDGLTIEEAEEVLNTWKLRGPHGG